MGYVLTHGSLIINDDGKNVEEEQDSDHPSNSFSVWKPRFDGQGENDKGHRRDFVTEAEEEVPLGRKQSGRSLASEILEQRRQEKQEKEEDFSLLYIFKRFGALQSNVWKRYSIGVVFAICTHALPPFVSEARSY